ncbi:MAG: N-acetyltransferase [Planctomycetia bacterium]|nr:N-acetyltransferase [Planctomycetia bacterium]
MTDFEYVKRYQMVFDFRRTVLVQRELPSGFFWVPWKASLVDTHARVHFNGFRDEIDTLIFPSFTRFDAGQRLLRQITSHPDFVPGATLLIARQTNEKTEYCATIQGMKHGFKTGNIQNVAVLPQWRKHGLGHALLTQALAGFRQAGCDEVTLDVTAENGPAVELYHSIGFTVVRTTFKETCFSKPFF